MERLLELLERGIAICEKAVQEDAPEVQVSEPKYEEAIDTSDDEVMPIKHRINDITDPALLWRVQQIQPTPAFHRLRLLYDEEFEAMKNMRDHVLRRIRDPSTPDPPLDHNGEPGLPRMGCSPQFAKLDYIILGTGMLQRMQDQTDAWTRSRDIPHWRLFQVSVPPLRVPDHVVRVLEAYWSRYGYPNQFNVFILWQMLRIPPNNIRQYFQQRVALSKYQREARDLLAMKYAALERRRSGLGENVQDKEKNEGKEEEEPEVADMD